MMSRTSFFNFTVLWKDLTRFWPLWGILLAIRLMTLSTGITTITPYAYSLTNMTLAIGQCFFGWFCAVLLFGDLFKARAAGTLHALPIRREGWFLTHSVAGILMYVLASGIPRVATMLTLQQYWYLEALVLVIEFGMFLFFFGLAAFCIQCTGSWFGSGCVYAVLNLLVVILMYLAKTFFEPQFYGVRVEADFLQYLCPLISLSGREFFTLETTDFDPVRYLSPEDYKIRFTGLISGDWWYLLAVVIAGLAFFALALLLYRRRHVESAGSFIVLRPVGILFLVLTTLFIGAVWFTIGDSSYILLAFGLVLGFFPVLMLLEKRLKVFRKSTLFAFGILALAVFGSIFLARLDPLGVDTFVPKPEQVKSATVETGYHDFLFSTTMEDAVTLDTPEELAMLETLHKTFLEEKGTVDEEGSYTDLFITYQLRSGRKLYRVYPIAPRRDSKQQSKQLLSRIDTFQDTDFLRNVLIIEYKNYSDVVYYDTPPEVLILAEPLNPDSSKFKLSHTIRHKSETLLDQDPIALGLWEALWKDCKTGAMAQDWDYHTSSMGYLSITYLDENGNKQSEGYTIYVDCANLREYLLSLKTD